MELAYMHGKSAEREGIDVFGGLNARPVIADNEFSQMLNAGWQEYPCAAPRLPRTFLRTVREPMGMIANKYLLWVGQNSSFSDRLYYYDESLIDDAPTIDPAVQNKALKLQTHVPRQLVNMGTRVCIFPDKQIFDTLTHTLTDMEIPATIISSKVHICNENGTTPTNFSSGTSKPEQPAHHEYFYEIGTKTLYIYDKFSGEWYPQSETYIRIDLSSPISGLHPEDGVDMFYSGLVGYANSIIGVNEGYPNYGLVNIFKATNTYLVLRGLVDYSSLNPAGNNEAQAIFNLRRTVPAMDYVCEMGNRLWGCRYGENNDGVFVNEIYASALGDPTNWQKFLGTSADSYIMSVGSSGKFTGIVNHLGYVMAFKEDIIHKVYGTRPSNFQLLDTKARGIAQGSERSACIIDETLYFMSPYDVVGMRAGLPSSISEKVNDLGLMLGVGGEYQRRYYLCCQSPRSEIAPTKKHLFIFDPETGNWLREDARDVKYMAKSMNHLYMIMQLKPEDGSVYDKDDVICGLFMVGDEDSKTYRGDATFVESTNNIAWRYDSGLIGLKLPDHKYVSNIQIRLDAFEGANVVVDVRFDNQDRDSDRAGIAPGWGNGWHRSYRYDDMKNRQNIRVPIRTPPRCDTMQISIHGHGKVRLYSVVKTIEVSEEW